MKALAFVLAGFAAGVFSGSLGMGGAALATPLIRFLGVAPHLAVGTTVPAMIPTALTGAWTYRRAGLLDLRSALWTAGAGAIAAVAGAVVTRLVDGHLLMVLTAILLLALALQALPTRRDEPAAGDARRSPARLLAVGGAAGFFSGLLGVGGGFILVPAMVRPLRFPVKLALGTSLATIALTSVPNMLAHWAVGNIDWRVAALVAAGVIPGARVGALLAIRAGERALRRAVAGAVALLAVVYGVTESRALWGG